MPLIRNVFLTLTVLLSFAGTIQAGKRDKPRVESGPSNIVDFKMNLVPFLTGGVVIGEAGDLIDRWGGDATDRALYGFGLSVSYYPQPRYGLQLTIERAYKTLPGDNVSAGQGWLHSAGVIYNLRTLASAIPYLRFDAGFLSAKWPRTGPDVDLGSCSYIRCGIGLFTYSSKRINMRYELYYTHAFSEGKEIDYLGGYEVDFSSQLIGAEFGIGFPILER